MQHELIFSGFGGQGVMFAGQLLAYAAMDTGYHVTWIPSYGPEMRGGTAHCTVVISDKPIGSPVVRRPQIAIVFNKPSFDKYEPLVRPGGLLVINSSLVDDPVTRERLDVLRIPATQMAEQVGTPRLTNVVLLGALLAERPILPVNALCDALDAHIPAHRRNLLPQNIEAVRRGAAYAGDFETMGIP
ncbi:MAG: 2-oxoacid:ferredoxin oxidoreductase subunit gamma [Chloroflexi bacterium]|nr:2-oxoacid:ferredoxin oxidoreductase subunit gamma [Chloroflexota bacterium]